MKQTSLNFIHKIDVSADEGISYKELAPMLLNLGDLLNEANRLVNPSGKDIAVNIKPFEKGSFIVDVLLFAGSNYEKLTDLLQTNDAENLKNLLEWLGIITGIGGGGLGLLQIIKLFKGKVKTIQPIEKNQVRIEGDNNVAMTAPSEVGVLLQSCNIQNLVLNSYGKSLEKGKVESYVKGEEEGTKVVLEKEDVESFKQYANSKPPVLEGMEESVDESEIQIVLRPKRGAFDGDCTQWSFTAPSNGQIITVAKIRDEEFMKKFISREINPRSTDSLEVRLLQKIKKVDGLIDPNSVTYEILEVLEYKQNNYSDSQDQIKH